MYRGDLGSSSSLAEPERKALESPYRRSLVEAVRPAVAEDMHGKHHGPQSSPGAHRRRSCSTSFLRMANAPAIPKRKAEIALTGWMVDRFTRARRLHAELQRFEGERRQRDRPLDGDRAAKVSCSTANLDTHPATEGWTIDPSTSRRQLIYGIGVSNMKAGDRAYFCVRGRP